MINGVDYIGFFITFGGGFILGMLMGIVVAVNMAADSEVKNGETDEGNKTNRN